MSAIGVSCASTRNAHVIPANCRLLAVDSPVVANETVEKPLLILLQKHHVNKW